MLWGELGAEPRPQKFLLLLPGTPPHRLSNTPHNQSSKMAPIEKKRVQKDAQTTSMKRQKVHQKDGEPEHGSTAKALSLDTLPWQEVAFPESGFEDAEGFFGLEEISDVDVVRDLKLGKVEYKVRHNLGSVLQETDLLF